MAVLQAFLAVVAFVQLTLIQNSVGQFILGAEVQVTVTDPPKEPTTLADISLGNPYIQRMDVRSQVSSGFADTEMSLTIINNEDVDRVITFNLLMPADAFIANYTVSTYGQEKSFYVDDGAKIFDFEVSEDEAEVRTFSISMTVPADSAAIVQLNYQELLRRMNGEYIHRIHLSPGLLAEDIDVEVNMDDHLEMTFIESLWESSDPDSRFDVTPSVAQVDPSTAYITFDATSRQQRKDSLEGLNGYLTIAYDVEQGTPSGSITVYDDYFLHRISPQELVPITKEIIYLVDNSEAMEGIKLDQLKLALEQTINQLRRSDKFNIVTFSDIASAWKDVATKATEKNKASAISYVKGITTSGESDIFEAMKLLLPTLNTDDDRYHTIVLFTNGISSDVIRPQLGAITKTIDNRHVLDVVAIGSELLNNDYYYRKLAWDNNGNYRLVMPSSNAHMDILSFLQRYSTPLMWNVATFYPPTTVNEESLTKHDFLTYYDGQDLVVAGRLNDDFNGDNIIATVIGNIQGGTFELELSAPITRERRAAEHFSERAWKFLTLRDKIQVTNLQTTDARTRGQNEVVEMAENFRFILDQKALPPQAIGGRGDLAGGDPHIVILDANSDLKMCFDIHGPEDMVVNLIDDPVIGITVNGEMVEKFNYTSLNPDKQTPSFFGKIAIRLGDDWVTVSRDRVLVNGNPTLKWYRNSAVQVGDCKVMNSNRKLVKISCPNGVVMKVYRHRVYHGNSDHFDFQLVKGGMFSPQVNGIIDQQPIDDPKQTSMLCRVEITEKIIPDVTLGQFQRREMTLVESSIRVTKFNKQKAILLIDGKEVGVSKVSRRRIGSCWASYVRQGLRMLEMRYENYIVGDLYSKPSYYFTL